MRRVHYSIVEAVVRTVRLVISLLRINYPVPTIEEVTMRRVISDNCP